MLVGILMSLGLFSGGVARASEFPSQPLTMIVPYAAGGSADVLGRVIAIEMAKILGQGVIVELKPGAGGNIGAEYVAKNVKPDGYTFLFASVSLATSPSLSKISFSPQNDLSAVAGVATIPSLMLVSNNAPYRNVKEFVTAVKANKVQASFGSSGNNTGSHLVGELFKVSAGIEMTHVPYKGSVPAITDLIGGQSSFYFDNTFVLVPFTNSGKLRIIATSGQTRSVATKDIPTVIESGVPDFELIGWWCLLAPAHTPDPILQWLNKEVASILNSKEIKEHLIALGNEPFPTSTADTRSYMASQRAFYKTIVALTNTKLN